jgi:hypothetical protein
VRTTASAKTNPTVASIWLSKTLSIRGIIIDVAEETVQDGTRGGAGTGRAGGGGNVGGGDCQGKQDLHGFAGRGRPTILEPKDHQ